MAEELYICMCQQLNGYGQEPFIAKDEVSQDVTLGISVSGIFVSGIHRKKFYPWGKISNVVNHKRTFNIECMEPQDSVGFTLRDADTGRYVWRLCVLQHMFFMKHECGQTNGNNGNPVEVSQQTHQIFANGPDLSASHDDLISDMNSSWNVSTTTGKSWTPSDHNNMGHYSNLQSRNSLQTSAANLSQVQSDYVNGNVGSNWGIQHPGVGSSVSLINRTQSSSCLDLSNNNVNLNHERERLKALLPQYRPAPDYETVIQQRNRASSSEVKLNQHHLSAQMLHMAHINSAGSQPEMHRFGADTTYLTHQLAQQYPDVTHHTQPHLSPNYSNASDYAMPQRLKVLIQAPPPYPVNRLSSTSTPDLYRAPLGYHGGTSNYTGSSPDLLCSRGRIANLPAHFHNPHAQIIYPQMWRSQNILPHGTYENLNFLDPKTAALPMQKIYENEKVAYVYQQTPSIQLQAAQHINGSIEPIYENIPLAWPNGGPPQMQQQHQPQPQPQQRKTPKQPQVLNATTEPTLMPKPRAPERKSTPSHAGGSSQLQLTQQPQPVHKVVQPQPSSSGSGSGSGSNKSVKSSPTIQTTVAEVNGSPSSHPLIAKSISNQLSDIKVPLSTTNSIAETGSSCPSDFEMRNRNESTHSRLSDQHQLMGRSHSTNNMLDSSQGSNYTVETNTTQTTTDSGISADSKKKRSIWSILSRSKGNSSDKQKSATLGREKHKDKKGATLSRDEHKHRWSTGASSKLHAFPRTISKEELVSFTLGCMTSSFLTV